MPNVDKGCTTHSYACDCREEQLREVYTLIRYVVAEGGSRFAAKEALAIMEKMGYGK
jgi:hypothetical protein